MIKRVLILFLAVGWCCGNPCRSQPPGRRCTHCYPIPEVIEKIEARGVQVIVRPDLFDHVPPVRLDLPFDAPPELILRECCRGLDVVITVKDNIIRIAKRAAAGSSLYKDLEGRVMSADGQPLPGMTVVARRDSVLSDGDGYFSIPVHAFETRVRFMGKGYVNATGVYSNKQPDTIVLEKEVAALDEVMVTDYGVTTPRYNIASVSRISGTVMEHNPTGNVLDGLMARATGFLDYRRNGVPGTAHISTLGGMHSLTGGNNPLYVVDDVPLASDGLLYPVGMVSAQGTGGAGSLNFLPPAIVAGTSMLKDASAAAIYGSQGCNGVILLTLQQPDSAAFQLTADMNGGIGKVVPTSRLLRTPEFLQLREEAVTNDGNPIDTTTVPELKWGTSRQTDYKHLTTGGTAAILNAGVTVTGGSPHAFFLTSGNWHRESTVFPGRTSDDRRSIYATLHAQSEKLAVVVTGLYTWEGNHLPLNDYSDLQWLAPNAPSFYNSAGNALWSQSSLSYVNIPAQANNDYIGNVETLLGHIKVVYHAWKDHLSIEQHLGYNGILTNEQSWQRLAGEDTSLLPLPSGSVTTSGNQYHSTILETLARWEWQPGRSDLKGMWGVEWQDRRSAYTSQQLSGYRSDFLLNAGAQPQQTTASGNQQYYRYAAVFGKVDYNLDNKYLMTASWRRDGSSRFGPGNQYGDFWGVGVGWLFYQERFLDRSRFLSYGKLRGSLGTTGNDQIGSAQYAEVYGPGPAVSSDPALQGVVPTSLPNNHLRWELNWREEAALELGFFHNKMLLSGSWYHNWSANQVVQATVAPAAGIPGVWSNAPVKVVNTGVEWVLETTVKATRQLTWSSAAMITIPRNKLASWPGLANSQYADVYVVGKSITVKKAYHLIGVDPQTGVYVFQTNNPSGVPGIHDEVPDRGTDPRWYAGWTNNLRFGNWELDLLLDWRVENAINPLVTLAKQNAPGMEASSQLSNGPTEWLDHWRHPGDHAPQQLLTAGQGKTYSLLMAYIGSDAGKINGSFLRLKSLNLSYRLPPRLLQKLGLKEGKLVLDAQDVWTWTHFPVTDPETQDPTVLPPLRIVTGGIRIGL